MTHYTDQQWKAYIQGDELDRASMDTHLLECDACMDIYLIVVEDLHELLPEITNITAFSEGVLQHIKSLPTYSTKHSQPMTHRRWYTNMFFHYTIAASLTILLVGSGIFDQIFDRVSEISENTEQAQRATVSDQLTNKAGQWLDSIPAKQVKKEGKP